MELVFWHSDVVMISVKEAYTEALEKSMQEFALSVEIPATVQPPVAQIYTYKKLNKSSTVTLSSAC
jgi:hypothetical protein